MGITLRPPPHFAPPFFQPARLSYYGRDFSALRPGMLEGLLPDSPMNTGIAELDAAAQDLDDRAHV